MIINQTTHVSGYVNDVSFTGEGGGTINTATNVSTTQIVYTNFPANYIPLLCRSWKCKAHPPGVDPIDGMPNYIKALGGNFDMDEVVRYVSGASGEIHTTGQTRRVTPPVELMEQVEVRPTYWDSTIVGTFDGTYEGPIDVQEIPVHWEVFEPTSTRGLLNTVGYREVVMVSGGKVVTEWSGTLTMILDPGADWDPFAFKQTYTWNSFSWSYGTPTSVLNKQFTLSVSVP